VERREEKRKREREKKRLTRRSLKREQKDSSPVIEVRLDSGDQQGVRLVKRRVFFWVQGNDYEKGGL